ncbi:MAG: TldD/PmbA family protein [Leptospirales bacterium]|nr:TldD/PmbA family protein [Leptospirales bacterium]
MNEKYKTAVDIGRKILESSSCDYAEIRLSSSVGTIISLSGENVDSFTLSESVAGSVRVLVNGSWGFATFNDLAGLEKFYANAIYSASLLHPTEKSVVAKSKAVNGEFKTEVLRDFMSISPDEKFELAKRYNNILKNSESVQSTRVTYRDVKTEYTNMNSEGSFLSFDKSYCGISLASIAKRGAVIQPFHESVSAYSGFEIVENRESLAEDVVKRAVDLLDAEPAPSGTYNIIADPKLSGVFIHEAFGHMSEADFIHENPRMKDIMVIGKEFGPQGLNVYDDGTLHGFAGYIPFDDEGILPSKIPLIKDGLLSGRLHSRETAAKMNEELTGNGRAISVMRQPIVRMTNTYIDNGEYSKDDIFASMDDGLYAVDVIGGQTNLEMFTFTAGYGYLIKNGKPKNMFRDIVLTGNVFNTLKNIEMIGNDKELFGGLGGCGKGGQSPLPVSFGGPHIKIKDVLIGGRG